MSVALCMIVKNEHDNINECLDSLRGFYDIAFITDTGSTDDTVSLLEKRNDVVLSHFDWIDDFAAARNFNLQQVSSEYDWILWCDADDKIIDDHAHIKFRKYISDISDEFNSVDMPYVYSHSEHSNDNITPDFKYYRKRLFRNNAGSWRGFIHEYPHVPGNSLCVDDIIFHHFRDGDGSMNTKRNLRIFKKRLADIDGEDRARYTFYYAKELTYNGLYDEAEEQFLNYIPISNWVPEKARAMYELAVLYSKRGLVDDARKWCFKCIQLEPHNSDAYVLLSNMSYDEDDYTSCYLWSYHALNSDDEKIKFFDFIPNRTWIPLELMAWSKWKSNQYDEAISIISKALSYVPKNKYILKTLEHWLRERCQVQAIDIR